MPRWPVALVLLLLAGGPAAAQTPATATPVAGLRGERPIPYPVLTPPRLERAVANGTRTARGAPGPRYWQQWTDYRIRARLDAAQKRLSGNAHITYHNRSPDTLATVFLHLFQNLHAPGARRNEENEVTGGVTLQRVVADGTPIAQAQGAGPAYAVDGTILGIRLPRPLHPGDSARLEIDWSFAIPRSGAGRMGWSRDNLFFLAYWYPQMAVYDDVNGWNRDQYLGLGEFYTGFGSYDVTIDAPEGWVVTGTGELANEAEVLPAAVRARLARARTSDRPVPVLTAADFGAGKATVDAPGDRLQWRFRAQRVRDFAFGATRESLWDAARAPVGDRDGDGRVDHALVNSLYRADAPRWKNATEYGQHSLRFLSEFTGYPYPWPHMTAVEGEDIIGGGMEYPMMTLIGSYTRGTDQSLYEVVVHEIAHMWVPMIVGTNETRYGWIDEGTTSFNEANAVAARYDGGPEAAEAERAGYLALARAGGEGEMMRWTDFHTNTAAFGIASYTKPSTVLRALRAVLGEETFRRGYHGFIRDWAYRHPTPWDFFNAFEAAAGRDLDWFWSSWYFTTWTLDQAVGGVASGPQGTTITVRDLGLVPMPARLRITRQGGEVLEREVPVETWLSGTRTATVTVPAGPPVVRVEIDPGAEFPDVDRKNNVWTP